MKNTRVPGLEGAGLEHLADPPRAYQLIVQRRSSTHCPALCERGMSTSARRPRPACRAGCNAFNVKLDTPILRKTPEVSQLAPPDRQ